jgi:hypothetical protein
MGQLYLFGRTALDMKEKEEGDQIRTTKHEAPHHAHLSILENILLRALFSDSLSFEKLLLINTAVFMS